MSGVIWSMLAKIDLWSIGEYWSQHSPGRTADIADRIDDAVAFIAAPPRAGPSVYGPARKWRIRQTDYILLYRLLPDSVEILRVHHARENWRSAE